MSFIIPEFYQGICGHCKREDAPFTPSINPAHKDLRCDQCNKAAQKRLRMKEIGIQCTGCLQWKSKRGFSAKSRRCKECKRKDEKARRENLPRQPSAKETAKLLALLETNIDPKKILHGKKCAGPCNEWKKLSKFSGRDNFCKQCRAKYQKERRKRLKIKGE